jgi:hypothetical protein
LEGFKKSQLLRLFQKCKLTWWQRFPKAGVMIDRLKTDFFSTYELNMMSKVNLHIRIKRKILIFFITIITSFIIFSSPVLNILGLRILKLAFLGRF